MPSRWFSGIMIEPLSRNASAGSRKETNTAEQSTLAYPARPSSIGVPCGPSGTAGVCAAAIPVNSRANSVLRMGNTLSLFRRKRSGHFFPNGFILADTDAVAETDQREPQQLRDFRDARGEIGVGNP